MFKRYAHYSCFRNKVDYKNTYTACPGHSGGWSIVLYAEKARVDSWSGDMPRLWVRSRSWQVPEKLINVSFLHRCLSKKKYIYIYIYHLY